MKENTLEERDMDMLAMFEQHVKKAAEIIEKDHPELRDSLLLHAGFVTGLAVRGRELPKPKTFSDELSKL
jgi:hypothetical protein